MRVLQVNNADLIGRRFNGFDLIEPLHRRGIECGMAVLDKSSDDDRVRGLADGRLDGPLRAEIQLLEARYGMNGILYPWGDVLVRTEEYRAADVVHYHLIHNQLISLLDLPRLFADKPSVWTFHDSWPLTAHCIQPCGCDGWMSGCGQCANSDRPFPLPTENSEMMWKVKNDTYARVNVDIVVATDHMLERVRTSPLGKHFDSVHLIPFGVGSMGVPDRESARASLGIASDSFVILFRAASDEVKGLQYLIEALSIASPRKPTTLLAVEKTGLLLGLPEEYDIREYGWADDALYAQLLGACDVVLAPYPWAVGMGLMAVEAMVAARTIVCFEDTSIAAVTYAPECGVSVPNRDARALRAALDRLMDHPEECRARGKAGQEIALRQYSQERYVDGMARLYEQIHSKSARGAAGPGR